jgi:hypothetical protein
MKTHLSPIAKWVSAALITFGAGVLSANAIAATPANTTISNTAVVTYQDETGNEYSAQSDAATIKVAQIYSSSLVEDLTVSGSRGQLAVTAHTLTNTGNGSDEYTITYGQDLPATDTRGADTLDATTISMVWDTSGDGEAQAGEPIIASGSTITLSGGQAAQLLLLTGIPTSATATDTVGVQMTSLAHEGGLTGTVPSTNTIGSNNFDSTDGTNADLIKVTVNAVVNFTKSSTHLVDQFTETDLNQDIDGIGGIDPTTQVNVIRYEIIANNVGEKAAQDIVIFDGAPDGTVILTANPTFAPTDDGLVESGDTPPTFAADITDEATNDIDLDKDGNKTDADESTIASGLDLNQDGDTVDSGIPGIFAFDDSLPKNNGIKITFHVAYAPSALEGNKELKNVAYFCAELDENPAVDSAGECNDPDPNTAGPKPTPPTTHHQQRSQRKKKAALRLNQSDPVAVVVVVSQTLVIQMVRSLQHQRQQAVKFSSTIWSQTRVIPTTYLT